MHEVARAIEDLMWTLYILWGVSFIAWIMSRR